MIIQHRVLSDHLPDEISFQSPTIAILRSPVSEVVLHRGRGEDRPGRLGLQRERQDPAHRQREDVRASPATNETRVHFKVGETCTMHHLGTVSSKTLVVLLFGSETVYSTPHA